MKIWKDKQQFRKLFKRKKSRKVLLLPGILGEERPHDGNWDTSSLSLDSEGRWRIISAYGKMLEGCASPINEESNLPYPKELIREAIYRELMENPDVELRVHLEIAYVRLESFLPAEEYALIEDFKQASTLAEEMAKSGSPRDIVASARILKQAKGEKVVKIQERISEKMRRRLKQLQCVGMPILPFKMPACPVHM